MTEKLFYEDSHMITFSAIVEACEKVGDYYEAVLDRTAFFPEFVNVVPIFTIVSDLSLIHI